ncbi:MAG: cytidine deaminase [Flavobacteriaceae bacterium]|nr:cytidine deaminase [Flavobacteriaceae bacterium]
MKNIKIEINLKEFDAVSELPVSIQKLMNKAHEAREKAYAPYSRFKVGAALQLKSGEIVTGNNQENAAYPSGLCAERVAIFHAGSQHPDATFVSMAITAKSLNHVLSSPIAPCGACRQVLAEYEVKQDAFIEIYFMGETGKIIKASSVKDLLPLIFDAAFL